jgi:formylglycine-generating enzyme required for sulfatase activity
VLSKQPDGTCYWIDRTEVTVQQYSLFIAAHTSIRWDQIDLCTWKTALSDPAHQPGDSCAATTMPEANAFAETKPIRCVDWCDAKAFCKWVNADLCTGVTNGSFVGSGFVVDQWGGACSAKALQYPYGATAVARACNVGLSEAAGECYTLLGQVHCAPTTVGTFSQCTSPSGAVDMIGNVAEWVGECSASDGSDGGPDSTRCQHRGGSFDGSVDDENETCYGSPADAVSFRDRGLGFRCCALRTLDEQTLTGVTSP